MEISKKTIVLSSIAVLIIVLLIILSIIKSNVPNNSNRLLDEKTFFEINDLINKYEENDLYIYHAYNTTNIYYKDDNLVKLYFATGFIINHNIDTEYIGNVNYLIKVKGVNYEITKLDNVKDIKEYADNYTYESNDINSDLIIPTVTYDEKNKLIYYLSTFENLLLADPNEAYNYLSDSQKKKYNGVNDFKNNITNIYNNLSDYISNYNKTTDKNETIYTINTDKSQIKIYENGIMNIKIEY